VLQKYLSIAVRLIFALWYFGVGIIGFITNDAVKDAATAATPLEKAMAQSLFMNPLLCRPASSEAAQCCFDEQRL